MDASKIAQLMRRAADALEREEVMYAMGLDHDHVRTTVTEVVTDSKGQPHAIEVERDEDEATAEMDEEIEEHEEYVASLRQAAKIIEAEAGVSLHEQVIVRLAEQGVTATLEYPGALALQVSDTEAVWTGLTGWDHGSVNVLEDGTWQPAEGVTAEPVLPVEENDEDPDRIATAWSHWVIMRRGGHL